MDSSAASLLVSPPLELSKKRDQKRGVVYDSSLLRTQAKIPKEFIWPRVERPRTIDPELDAPVVDLGGFLSGDEASAHRAADLVGAACRRHGFFQVTNHGVDASLAQDALHCMAQFFKLPLARKLRARRKPGSMWGYAGAHVDRFSSKLPWKETLSFGFDGAGDDRAVVDYFKSVMGQDFEPTGWVHQRYCNAVAGLSLAIMELLAMSLGVERGLYRELFEEGSSIVRCNNYPPCQEPELTMGTGPHCDPTALTVLLQDQVAGLEVFADGRWRSVNPVRGALVINIGDTFEALSNGKYRSCLHRAVVNRHKERRSLAFFLCPRGDRVVRPPAGLGGGRRYPDFTWSELLEFTQTHYRADTATLQSFARLRRSSQPLA